MATASPRRSPGSLMKADHDRLDRLLSRVERTGFNDASLYDEFREGLLRHIWIEEHLMIPGALTTPSGRDRREEYARLRLDHGALTALLVPVPGADVVAAIRGILGPHNRIEEGDAGLYAICDAMPAGALIEAMRRAPKIPLRACDPRPSARAASRRALGRAGYDPDRWLGGGEGDETGP